MHATLRHLLMRLCALGALGLAAAGAQAATITVMKNGDIDGTANLGTTASCNSAGTQCDTLREAINLAKSGDTIEFAPSLDGKTIALSRYTNCLKTTDQTVTQTCLPLVPWPLVAGSTTNHFVSQFGPSAFFISGKTLTIDATANGLKQGVVLSAKDANTTPAACGAGSCFRLFDIDPTGSLTLKGLTLTGGRAQGGGVITAAGRWAQAGPSSTGAS